MRPVFLQSRSVFAGGLILLATITAAQQSTPGTQLPNGHMLTIVPGRPEPTNSLPTNAVVSPDQRYVVLLNGGYGTYSSGERQSLAVLDRESGQLTDFPDDRLGRESKQNYFLGLAFSHDGRRLYASMSSMTDPLGKDKGDTGNGIAVYRFEQGRVTAERFLSMPARGDIPQGKVRRPDMQDVTYPAGLSIGLSNGEERILVANNLSDEAVLLSAKNGKVVHRFDLSVFRRVPTALPYTTVMSADGRTGYVSLWNASTVAELDLAGGRVLRQIPVGRPSSNLEAGSHPGALLLSKDESILFVALANRDEVVAIDRRHGNIVSHLSTKLPGQQFGGSDPNALALSPDGKRLFVADAISDSVAVFDVANVASADRLEPLGFIPTEWYPTALAIAGDDLLVASGKGRGSGPSETISPANSRAHQGHQYIAALIHGSLARIPLRSLDSELPRYTQQVIDDNRSRGNADHVEFAGGGNPIHHVIYIIKENRTYDQLFGDLGAGDGDASLAMYGEEITPNQHKLARQFGVLDNFYDSGDVSGNGHVWSTSATVSDYVEKTWPIAYRGKERSYDYEGENLKEIPLDDDNPDASEPASGYLWKNFARHGVTYRHYGEYIVSKWCKGNAGPEEKPIHPEGEPCPLGAIRKGETLPGNVGQPHGSPSPYAWAIPVLSHNQPTKPELRSHFDPLFPDFELNFPDQLRVDEFLNEFAGFTKSRVAGTDTMPQFILLRLPNDHTAGGRKGSPTPSASVADNDLAVGRVVDAISHSPYWDDTALFILEDDAQDGPDHVDAHRSIALVISKYSPRPSATSPPPPPFVDHNFYTTVNILRTMESLLGAPPMNVNDARAAVMSSMFSGKVDQPPFEADARNRENGLIYQANTQGWREGAKLDFSHADAVDTALLNRFLWKDRMGPKPMPPPQHNVFHQ